MDDEYGSSVAERVRSLRRAAGLNQQDLGAGELSASYVSLIEQGKRIPTARALEVIADSLETSVEYLMTGRDQASSRRLELRVRGVQRRISLGESGPELLDEIDELLASSLPGGLHAQIQLLRVDALRVSGMAVEALEAAEVLSESLVLPVGTELWHHLQASRLDQYRDLGDIDFAIHVGETALQQVRQRELQADSATIRLVISLAEAYADRGDLERSRQLLHSAQSDSAAPNVVDRASLLWGLSRLAEQRGEMDLAIDLSDRALQIMGQRNDVLMRAHVELDLARVHLSAQPVPVGVVTSLLESARREFEGAGDKEQVFACDVETARLHVSQRRYTRAIKLMEAARPPGAAQLSAVRSITLAAAYLGCGRLPDFESAIADAERFLSSVSRRCGAKLWTRVGDLHRQAGDGDRAAGAFRHAVSLLGVS